MGEYAEDLINDFSHELSDDGFNDELSGDFSHESDIIMFPSEYGHRITYQNQKTFEVSIIHRKTGVCYWTGKVKANSKKDAQSQFRKEYPHIRNQYTHEYGLGIKLLR